MRIWHGIRPVSYTHLDVYKRQVLENKAINVESDKEDFVEIECSNEVLLANVDEVTSVCEEELEGQRASFPQDYGETGVSHVFYEDSVSSCSCIGDMVSQNGPLSCCSDVFVSGKVRKYFNDFMWPFAWNEIVQGGWEKYCERERGNNRVLYVEK